MRISECSSFRWLQWQCCDEWKQQMERGQRAPKTRLQREEERMWVMSFQLPSWMDDSTLQHGEGLSYFRKRWNVHLRLFLRTKTMSWDAKLWQEESTARYEKKKDTAKHENMSLHSTPKHYAFEWHHRLKTHIDQQLSSFNRLMVWTKGLLKTIPLWAQVWHLQWSLETVPNFVSYYILI